MGRRTTERISETSSMGRVNDWAGMASRITENFGQAYDPKERKDLEPKLLRLLIKELPFVSNDAIARALHDALKIRFTIDWHRLLCIILSSLPGHWVKLTNTPGFGASTMLLLTDGTVMCQEEGGVRWKK